MASTRAWLISVWHLSLLDHQTTAMTFQHQSFGTREATSRLPRSANGDKCWRRMAHALAGVDYLVACGLRRARRELCEARRRKHFASGDHFPGNPPTLAQCRDAPDGSGSGIPGPSIYFSSRYVTQANPADACSCPYSMGASLGRMKYGWKTYNP